MQKQVGVEVERLGVQSQPTDAHKEMNRNGGCRASPSSSPAMRLEGRAHRREWQLGAKMGMARCGWPGGGGRRRHPVVPAAGGWPAASPVEAISVPSIERPRRGGGERRRVRAGGEPCSSC